GDARAWEGGALRRYPLVVSPLAALVLIGFLVVTALCLTVWAALSLAASPPRGRGADEGGDVPLARTGPAPAPRAAGPGRSAARGSGPTTVAAAARGPAPAAAGSAAPASGRTTVTARVKSAAVDPQPATERRASNDDHRGAKAKVTQRPNLDDAFERFLDHERKDR